MMTMFKVLIVDDEWLVREGLKRTIAWNDLDCEIVADASDGPSALELIGNLLPDLVLTDIRMPGMDGLELARQVAAQYPDIQIVFLTGFDEFHYAHQAIKLGAADFVLKPTDPEELKKVVRRVTQAIQERRKSKEYARQLESRLAASQPLLVEKMLYDLMLGNAGTKEMELFLEIWGGERERFERFRVVLAESSADPVSANLERLLSAASLGGLVRMNDGQYALIVSENGGNPDWEECLRWLEDEGNRHIVSVSMSGVHQGLEAVAEAYDEAVLAMQHKMVLGHPKLIRYESLAMDTGWRSAAESAEWAEREIVEAVKWGNEGAIREKVKSWYKALLEQRKPHEPELRRACFQFVFSVYFLLVRSFGMIRCLPDTQRFLEEIGQKGTSQELIRWLEDMLVRAHAELLGSAWQGKSEVQKLLDYIHDHYHEEISLQELAASVHMSESYFSRMFKKQTGASFVEYITKLRVDKAQELLRDPEAKIYEISLAVGYQDARYFSQIFRKYTGKTPTEFRRNIFKGTFPLMDAKN